MKITRISSLATLAIVVALLSWLLQKGLTTSGLPQLTPELALPIVLTGLAAIIILLAIPVRRRLKGDPKPLSPFYATNVLVLAKASALTGALFVGVGVGFLVFSFGLPVVVIDGRTWLTVATGVAGLVLAAAGLLAEWFCKLPPDKDEHDGASTPLAEA